jgi:glycosyltransferase involved in cell wall biosynthesis
VGTGVKVSVCTVTYNHERYLAQALDSALAQQTNFDFEIVVAEDCSTDGTRAVAEAYARRYPARIRLLATDKNLGLTRNTARTIDACRGAYIANLEGDDFWVRDDKLQRQVDYLDANRDCAWVFTRAQVVDAAGQPVEVPDAVRVLQPKYSLADYLSRKFQPRFCTVMFRRGLFTDWPEWFFRMPTADLPLHVLNCERGGMIGWLDEVMSAYRVHGGGVWSQGMEMKDWRAATPEQQRKFAARFEQLVELFEAVDVHLGGAHRDILRRRIAQFARRWTKVNVALGESAAQRRSAVCGLRAGGFDAGLLGAWLRSWL